jgi:multidrug transporter EmrE-like cation transporter
MLGYILVLIGAAATVSADYLAEAWARAGGYGWVIALAFYVISGASFIYSLKFGELTVLNATWSVWVFLATSLVGLFIFHERLSPVQWVAPALLFLPR